MPKATAEVAIIMGSQSDWETMKNAAEILDELKSHQRNIDHLGAPYAQASL